MAVCLYCLSVCPHATTPSGQVFTKFDVTFFKPVKKIKNLKRITGTLHEDLCTL